MIRVPDDKELGRYGRRDLIAIIRKLEEDRRELWRFRAIALGRSEEIPESELEELQ